ncbi:MAG: nucleoside triphosphate pyrophosphatase [Cyanobacteriota bacterium]|nr:nucleoside triphosphate pyrophosphatase [Cyanobacteriota bacterium]
MLLLASASPARRRLLQQAAIPHRVRVSGMAEEGIQASDPQLLVRRLAQAKAASVRSWLLRRAGKEAEEWGDVGAVLGCDSLLVVEGEVCGKPADAAEAIARWRRMAGGWGDLHTGHCLLSCPRSSASDPGPRSALAASGEAAKEWLATVSTRVRFAALSEGEIQAYVATGEPLQCAGGFALEGRGGLVVEGIEGCVSNVIGLSLPLLRRWLLELDQAQALERWPEGV